MHKNIIYVLALLAALSACHDQSPARSATAIPATDGPTENAEVETLRKRIAALEIENKSLRETPAAMLAAVQAAGDDADVAAIAARALSSKFPSSVETKQAEQLVEKLRAAASKREVEAQRLAALGLRALRPSPQFKGIDAAVALSAVAQGKRWTFDSYDGTYHYRDAEKGSQFVSAKIKVTSKDKDPKLPGIALYAAEGARMQQIGKFEYRFTRWDSFATYLGNHSDYPNDFAHTSAIPMTIGVEVEVAKLSKPLFIVVTKSGCENRSWERFTQPPVSYEHGSCDDLKPTLEAADFNDGNLSVLHRID